jgi:hypothetical protein
MYDARILQTNLAHIVLHVTQVCIQCTTGLVMPTVVTLDPIYDGVGCEMLQVVRLHAMCRVQDLASTILNTLIFTKI